MHELNRFRVLSLSALLAGIAAIVACGDSDYVPLPNADVDPTTTPEKAPPAPKKDSGRSSGAEEEEGLPDGGCAKAPQLRSNTETFYCGFLPNESGAATGGVCQADETCCNPGKIGDAFGTSFCATTPRDAKGAAFAPACAAQSVEKTGKEWAADKSSTWECADKNSCGEGQVCCAFTWANPKEGEKVNVGPSQDKNIPKACKALQSFTQGGTRCAATCGAEEIQLCSKTDDNCGSKKCTAFSASGKRDLAYCK
jgi:hypothetical protein